ncbi:MAG TPA: tetratricopeptide repeat protein [Pyrinomonadaceae bacterium]|nr:tetratricopeptide repeat protein [Pyrinomonadaceae bacterium]
MTFDRSKAMRNAERFIAQGKIRSAIDEYKQVVRHDSRDYITLNMLGDLHVKESNENEAIRCYNQVAEYYAKQGFSQKAIAIYNKIARLRPESPEVSEKLAELYKSKGSVSEAKSHYTTLAEHYLKKGYRTEAYAIWKQIGILDPNNTQVFITLAEAYLEDNQLDEAAEAYCEAAGRFSRAGDHTASVDALNKALAINASNVNCLNSFVRELSELGRTDEAVERLEDILKTNPRNREVARLLIDCHINCGRPDDAEAVLIKLAEWEPSNYDKFLDLVKMYVERGEASSASRALTMCSEHMLMGGQSEELETYINTTLAIDSDDLASLRLLARFHSWKRDKDGLQETLIKIATVAKEASSVDDERYALSQLTILIPHQTEFSDRLNELNELHGFVDNPFDNRIIQEQFNGTDSQYEFETNFAITSEVSAVTIDAQIERDGHANGNGKPDIVEMFDAEIQNLDVEGADIIEDEILTPKYETELDKELESIRFYLENEYFELASRTLEELRQRFGNLPEFNEFDVRLKSAVAEQNNGSKPLDIAEIRNEFGIDDLDPIIDDGDYDTHYQMGIAYQEMGLTEEAIKEYQDAVALVRPNDGTKRFLQCANLLGHCFMESGMANLALTWYRRALETNNLTDDEKQGIWYELARAYEADGDVENAGRYFEQVYAENVDYRDVGECLKRISVQAA